MNKDNDRAPVERRVIRPGNGWKQLSGSVWEHSNGTRIHLIGMVKLPNGKWMSANIWTNSRDADMAIRINGGNRRRGLMAWAMTHNA